MLRNRLQYTTLYLHSQLHRKMTAQKDVHIGNLADIGIPKVMVNSVHYYIGKQGETSKEKAEKQRKGERGIDRDKRERPYCCQPH